ncbi:MAG: pitrilysin family protein [Bacteroidales bacterium]|nr:pitrilysin family protein [Bacteroidales bacterium]
MNKLSKLLLPVLLICFFCKTNAQQKAPQKSDVYESKISFTEYDLPNGLHVILHRDNSTPVVAVSISYHVGSKNEKPDRTGFAHFFEHLMFEGSPNINRGEFFKIVQNAGGSNNANTSFDRTFYFEKLPSNQLELGLWLESERLFHLRIDSTGVETQRNVIKEERKQGIDNRPYGTILEQTFSHAYKVHPYRWTPIGSAQYIDKAKIEEFREFHDTYYVPQNATISIAGDIDIDKTKELIKNYFGDIPKGTREIYRPKEIEPPQTKEVRDTVFDNIQIPAIIMAYHMPAQGTKDYYALSMLTTLISDGESSRLYKSIVDKQQKAMQVAAFPFALENPGLFIVFGLPNMGIATEELEKSIETEITKVKTETLSENEFQKLKNKVENDFINKNSNVLGIAENLSDYHVYFGDANLINTEINKYLSVTKDDIKRVANQYLTKENRVVLYYLPKSSEK